MLQKPRRLPSDLSDENPAPINSKENDPLLITRPHPAEQAGDLDPLVREEETPTVSSYGAIV